MATATQAKTVTTTWGVIIAGAGYIRNPSQSVIYLAMNTTTPTVEVTYAIPLQSGESLNYTGDMSVYGKVMSGTADISATEY